MTTTTKDQVIFEEYWTALFGDMSVAEVVEDCDLKESPRSTLSDWLDQNESTVASDDTDGREAWMGRHETAHEKALDDLMQAIEAVTPIEWVVDIESVGCKEEAVPEEWLAFAQEYLDTLLSRTINVRARKELGCGGGVLLSPYDDGYEDAKRETDNAFRYAWDQYTEWLDTLAVATSDQNFKKV